MTIESYLCDEAKIMLDCCSYVIQLYDAITALCMGVNDATAFDGVDDLAG